MVSKEEAKKKKSSIEPFSNSMKRVLEYQSTILARTSA